MTSIRAALTLLIFFTLLTGLAYPSILVYAGKTFFPVTAAGSLVTDDDGDVIGSRLLGQAWTKPQFFHGRLSAAGAGYDYLSTAGSVVMTHNPLRAERLLSWPETPPPTLLTSSGSGVDPHIAPADAMVQVARVLEYNRHLTEAQILAYIAQATTPQQFSVLGHESVNVLELNRLLTAPAQ